MASGRVPLEAAWLLIRLATSLIRNETAVKLVSLTAWSIAALSILGLLDQTTAALDGLAITFGGHRFSLLLAIKVGALLAFALWLGNAAGFRGEELLTTGWIAALDCTATSARTLALEAKRIGLIDLRTAGEVVEFGLDRLDPGLGRK